MLFVQVELRTKVAQEKSEVLPPALRADLMTSVIIQASCFLIGLACLHRLCQKCSMRGSSATMDILFKRKMAEFQAAMMQACSSFGFILLQD